MVLDMKDTYFKEIMSNYPSGVTIITTIFEGKEYGFTASSVVSASLEPPLLLFCIGKHLKSFDIFLSSEYYGVNFLSTAQEETAVAFATQGKTKFSGASYCIEKDKGIPILEGSCGYILLKRDKIYDAGDHKIILGQALSGEFDSSHNNPLGYLRRKFIEIR